MPYSLDLLKVNKKELKIKRERLRLKDQELALDLQLVEARRKLIEEELRTFNAPPESPECKASASVLVPEYVGMDPPLRKEVSTSSVDSLPVAAPVKCYWYQLFKVSLSSSNSLSHKSFSSLC